MEPKWEPKSIKNRENPEKNEVRKSMRKKSAHPGLRGICRQAQRQLISTRFPSEKQQERKQPAENLSENKLNELRRKTIGKNR